MHISNTKRWHDGPTQVLGWTENSRRFTALNIPAMLQISLSGTDTLRKIFFWKHKNKAWFPKTEEFENLFVGAEKRNFHVI